jgi:3-oxoacyl-[acyl-carrier protein] reductase
MQLLLNNKKCIVTGASQGLGKAIAILLAAEQCDLVLVARRKKPLEEVKKLIQKKYNCKVVTLSIDVTSNNADIKIKDFALKQLGTIDVLINSAGGSRPTTWDAPESFWEEGMSLNFTALRKLTTRIIPIMTKNKWGRVINITGSVEPREVNVANAAKSAVHAWAKGLSRVVAADGITINSISPGRLNTEQILKRRHPNIKERKKFIKENIPVGYFGDPEDLACLAVFLSSPIARYITGELIHVDGGMKRFAH